MTLDPSLETAAAENVALPLLEVTFTGSVVNEMTVCGTVSVTVSLVIGLVVSELATTRYLSPSSAAFVNPAKTRLNELAPEMFSNVTPSLDFCHW